LPALKVCAPLLLLLLLEADALDDDDDDDDATAEVLEATVWVTEGPVTLV